jgi:hypothetical protein
MIQITLIAPRIELAVRIYMNRYIKHIRIIVKCFLDTVAFVLLVCGTECRE